MSISHRDILPKLAPFGYQIKADQVIAITTADPAVTFTMATPLGGGVDGITTLWQDSTKRYAMVVKTFTLDLSRYDNPSVTGKDAKSTAVSEAETKAIVAKKAAVLKDFKYDCRNEANFHQAVYDFGELSDLHKKQQVYQYHIAMNWVQGVSLEKFSHTNPLYALIVYRAMLFRMNSFHQIFGAVHEDLHAGNLMIHLDDKMQTVDVLPIDFTRSRIIGHKTYEIVYREGISAGPEFKDAIPNAHPSQDVYSLGFAILRDLDKSQAVFHDYPYLTRKVTESCGLMMASDG